jgi:hypothetical protein
MRGHTDVAGELDASPGATVAIRSRRRSRPWDGSKRCRASRGRGGWWWPRPPPWPGGAGGPRAGRRHGPTKQAGPRVAAACSPIRRTSAATESGSRTGAALASMKPSAKPATPLDQQAAVGGGEGGARPAGGNPLLGQHGHDGRPGWVLAGQEGERVAPGPLGGEPAGDRLGRAGAQPPLAAAGGPAEAEGGHPAPDHGGGRHRTARHGERDVAARPAAGPTARAARPAPLMLLAPGATPFRWSPLLAVIATHLLVLTMA